MFKTSMVMGFAALMLIAVLPLSAESDTGSRTFIPPTQVDLPTWNVGDFWLYNSSFTTSFAGWSNKIWTGHLNYTVQSTSASAGGYDCYRVDSASEPITEYPRLNGRSYVRKSDLSLVAMNWTEIGLTPTPYTHSYEIWFESVNFYDYYQFPIMSDMVNEKWYVNTTMNQHISNALGPNHFDITRNDVITMYCEFVGWSEEDPNLPENQIGEKIDGAEKTNGNDKDIRWYNPDYKSVLYRDFKYTYNESGSWAGTEKLITSNYKPAALNQPPHVTNPTAKPSTVQNDDSETTVLEVDVTDDSGIGYIAINLASIGYDSNTTMNKNPFFANRYYVTTTVKPTTLGGQHKLYVTATDNLGAFNNSVYITLTVTSTNDPPRVTDAKATPNSIPNDAKTASLLTANVNDTNLNTVVIDLSSLGGASTQQMYDDGTHGDATSGNGIFSYSTTAATATPPGSYVLKMNASDTAGLYNNTQGINISVFHKENSKPKIENPKAEPSTIPNNAKNQTMISAKVTDADSDPLTVTVNLTSIGGPAASRMYDDATHGDKTTGDNVYSVLATASKATVPNYYDLKITAYDGQDYVYSKVRVTVIETPPNTNTPPTITDVAAQPETVSNDGTGDVLFTASVSDMEGGNLTVTIDLSLLNGPSDREMLDNGLGADSKKNDGIYSAIFTIPEGTTAKTYTLTVTAKDEGSESDTQTVSLMVEEFVPENESPAITFMSLSQNTVTSGNRNVTVSAFALDPENDPFEVYVDLSSVGGSDRQMLYDDGTNGDVSAGDSTFSFKFTVPKETSNGNYTISTWVEQDGIQVGDLTTKPLRVNFISASDDDVTADDDDDSNPDDNKWIWVGLIIGIFLVFIIALLLFLRKPRGKGSIADSGANENTSGVQARL